MKPESSSDWLDLVDRYLNGTLGEEEFAELKATLRSDPRKRDQYFGAVKMDTLLREIASKQEPSARPGVVLPALSRRSWILAAGLVGCCLMGLVLLAPLLLRTEEAVIASAAKARWLSDAMMEGQRLRSGDQLRLASGSVEVRFRTGALTRIHGPALFEVLSGNGGFLYYGEARSQADTEESHGFTIETHTGKFMDQGTEFLTTASPDGFSQMHVSSGAVDVEVKGFAQERLGKGSGFGIEPGDTPVMIRIEQGDETPAFSFPTIPPPSRDDEAGLQQGRGSVVLISRDGKGRENLPHQESGPPELLLDGKAQTGRDQPGESFFFPNGAEGTILLDLGREIPVSRIHTYSWHLSEVEPGARKRAVQRYTLWGCGREKPATMPSARSAVGWTRIARVDTDAFFGVEDEPDRPAQQACAIHSNAPSIGTFRYLLFQVIPTPMPDGLPAQHTFFGEIDVFKTPTN